MLRGMVGTQSGPVRFLRELVFGAVMLALLAAAPAAEAKRHVVRAPQASLHYSSIVIDAATGQVLSATDADHPNYPASLTKMMTLYLAFEAIEEGKVSPDDRFTVSIHAARQAPSKLGLRPRETVPLRELILAVITHSANDAAVTIAENLAGNEDAFAQRMTAKARALGMNSTTFRNASGLPNPAQMTTARDLAMLARALWRDFPKQYALFATQEFTFKNVSYETHNHLMESFAGMDGIKTGYIHASGFNLAASAVRDGRRLIGVVMGGTSAQGRDMQMASLLDDAFGGSRPDIRTASTDDQNGNNDAAASRAGTAMAALNPVGRAEAATSPAKASTKHALRPDPKAHDWSIQVGAFADAPAADKAAAAALVRLGPKGKVAAAAVIPPGYADKEPLYRARLTGFTAAEADRACRTLHAKLSKHKVCAVIPPLTVALDVAEPAPAPTAAPAVVVPAAAPAPALDTAAAAPAPAPTPY